MAENNSLPSLVTQYYEHGFTEVPAMELRGDGTATERPRTIWLPDTYQEGMGWTDIERTVTEFGRNLEVSEQDGYKIQNTLAKDGATEGDGIGKLASIHSDYVINSGHPYEDALSHLAYALRLHVYNGSPGSGLSSFFPSADAQQAAGEGSYLHESSTEYLPFDLLQAAARVLSRRVEDGSNIGRLVTEDSYGMGMVPGFALALHREGHNISDIFSSHPTPFYDLKKHGLEEPGFSVGGIARTVNELLRGNKSIAELTPDPYWYDKGREVPELNGKKLEAAVREALQAGYEQTHGTRKLPGSQVSPNNIMKWLPKQKLNKGYSKTQASTGGEGFAHDAQVLLSESPGTNFTFLVMEPSTPEEAALQKSGLIRVMAKIATAQSTDARVRVYMLPQGLGMYPQQHFRGLWLGITKDALNL